MRIVHSILALLRSLALEGALVGRLAGYRERHPFSDRDGARNSPHAGR